MDKPAGLGESVSSRCGICVDTNGQACGIRVNRYV